MNRQKSNSSDGNGAVTKKGITKNILDGPPSYDVVVSRDAWLAQEEQRKKSQSKLVKKVPSKKVTQTAAASQLKSLVNLCCLFTL